MADPRLVNVWVSGFMSGISTALVDQLGFGVEDANAMARELADAFVKDPAAVLSVETVIDAVIVGDRSAVLPSSVVIDLDGWDR